MVFFLSRLLQKVAQNVLYIDVMLFFFFKQTNQKTTALSIQQLHLFYDEAKKKNVYKSV